MTKFTVFTAAPAFRHLGSATAALFRGTGRLLTALHPTLLLGLPAGRAAVVAAEGVGPLMRLRGALPGLLSALLRLCLTGGFLTGRGALGVIFPFGGFRALVVVSPV